jgi:hypothetical protein
MYSEDMYSVLNSHSVAKHTKFNLGQCDYKFPETYIAFTFAD